MPDVQEGYDIHTEYKNVEFKFDGVHLLWNCCAIVKNLLMLDAKVKDLEHRVEQLEGNTPA